MAFTYLPHFFPLLCTLSIACFRSPLLLYLRTRVGIVASAFDLIPLQGFSIRSTLFNSFLPILLGAGVILSSRCCEKLSVGKKSKTDQQSNRIRGFLSNSTSMATACCHKQYADECEILVFVDRPAPYNPGLYQRLRFGLLSSSWLPCSLGIFLWSALHVMLLIFVGPVFWVLILLTPFIFDWGCLFGLQGILICIMYVIYILFAVAADLVLLFIQSISFCWSLVGFPACHEPIVDWRGGAWWTVQVWKDWKAAMRNIFCVFAPIGVPCMDGSLSKETKDRKLETWARWCEEVVHMHDAISL